MTTAEAPPRDARIGDNSGVPYAAELDGFDADVANFLQGWDVWAKRGTLDDETAPRARDFYDGAGKLLRKIDAARKVAKKPHDDAGKAVDADFNARKTKLEKIIDGMKPMLDKFAAVLRERERAERARREAEAAEAAAQARAAALDAANAESASAKIAAQAAAEEAAARAKAAEKAAANVAPARIASATGLARNLGVRRQRKATLISLPLAVAHFKDAPELRECLERLANAELRAAGVDNPIAIAGFEIKETEGV